MKASEIRAGMKFEDADPRFYPRAVKCVVSRQPDSQGKFTCDSFGFNGKHRWVKIAWERLVSKAYRRIS